MNLETGDGAEAQALETTDANTDDSTVEVGEENQPESEVVDEAQESESDDSADDEPTGKTFSQAEVDQILQTRLARQSRKEARRVSQLEGRIEYLTQMVQKGDEGGEVESGELDARSVIEQAKAELKREQEQQTFAERRKSVIAQAKEADPSFDFDDFVEEVAITDQMAEAILHSDVGGKIVAHLNKNPELADKIVDMPKSRQYIELAKLELELSAPAPAKKTSAPAPAKKPVKGGSGTGKPKFYEGMSDAEFDKVRRQQIKNR